MTKSELRVKSSYVYHALYPTFTNNENDLGKTVKPL